jgi:hypothetical protein
VVAMGLPAESYMTHSATDTKRDELPGPFMVIRRRQ